MLFVNFFSILFSFMIVCTKNPIKTSIIILMAALFLFMKMSILSGNTWISVIAALLFSGGILIMFMILSSFHPNETPKKMNIKMMQAAILVMWAGVTWSPKMNDMATEMSMKLFYQNLTTSTIVTLVIMLYFMMFIKILSKEKTSMRLILC